MSAASCGPSSTATYAERVKEPRRRTLQDVADAAGLSKAATSYALRGLRGSSETQARVARVASELGYTVDPVARALAGGRSSNVVIVGSLRDLWQQDLAVMLSRALGGLSLNASIADVDASPSREEAVLAGLNSRQVEAVVALPVDPSAEYWADVPDEIRVVSIGDALTHRPEAPVVLFDNAAGVGTGLRHLADLGHRSVGVLAPALPATPGRPAEMLATSLGAELGLDVTVTATPAAVGEAAEATERLLRSPARPTALLCLSDSIAFGAYAAARRVGLEVPRELSVLGYDDSAMAPLVEPQLSTFAWDEAAIVAAAVDALHTPADELDDASRRHTFRPGFIPRASTAAPAV
jgi:DNA-binding LacI/PurR family transcriptional regulator